jgi:putative membrane protein
VAHGIDERDTPMTDDRQTDPAERFQVRTTSEAHFAWLRTRLALERTMMAYMRTAASLIGFGFTIFQFFYRFQQSPAITSVQFPNAAWYLGLALISCGVFASVYSLYEYRWMSRYLRSGGFAAIAGVGNHRTVTPLYVVSYVIIAVGVFAFLAVLLRLT